MGYCIPWKKFYSRWTWPVIVLVGLAFISRLGWLDLRPLHHDEGVNYWFASRILDTGRFAYDPTNYHGPLFFFSLFLSFLTFGISEFSLRLPAALYGIAAVYAVFRFSRRGLPAAIVAALLLLLSPSMAYYARYAIHESALVLFSLLSMLLLATMLEEKSIAPLPFFALAVALMLVTKETAVIMLFALAVISAFHWRRVVSIMTQPGSREVVLLSSLVFVLVYLAFYTSFFSHPKGLLDSFRGLSPWFSRGVEGAGHDKPWYYYLVLLYRYELPVVLFSAAGLWYAWRNTFTRTIVLWALVTVIAYSAIGYKTPWLVINLTVPLCVLAAIGFHRLPGWWGKRTVLFAGSVVLFAASFTFNVTMPWQDGNPYAYVHTDAEILGLVRRIDAAGKSAKVLIHTDDYWPLPFYLRTHRVEYLPESGADQFSNFSAYDFVVLPNRLWGSPVIPDTQRVERFKLRDGVTLLLAAPAAALAR